jgi:hypothetical protein
MPDKTLLAYADHGKLAGEPTAYASWMAAVIFNSPPATALATLTIGPPFHAPSV